MSFTALKTLRPFFTNDCGRLLVGGKVYSYEPGTLTPKATYKDAAGLTENTNPIILDASGEADIYINSDYRFQIFDRDGVLIDDVDLVAATQRVSSEFVLDASGLTQGQINNDVRLEQGQALTPTAAWPDVLSLIDQNGAPSIHDIPVQALLNRIQKLYEDAVLLSNAVADRYTKTEAGDLFIENTEKGVASGVATLDASGLLSAAQRALVNNLTTGGTDKALTAEQGKILNDQDFGIGQTYQNVTASRALATTYINSTSKPIAVIASCQSGSGWSTFSANVNAISLLSTNAIYSGAALYTEVIFIVPPSATYSITNPTNSGTAGQLTKWMELR